MRHWQIPEVLKEQSLVWRNGRHRARVGGCPSGSTMCSTMNSRPRNASTPWPALDGQAPQLAVSNPMIWSGCLIKDRINGSRPIRPSGPSATSAAGGRSRSAGSQIARTTTKGNSFAWAIRATGPLSRSIAWACVARTTVASPPLQRRPPRPPASYGPSSPPKRAASGWIRRQFLLRRTIHPKGRSRSRAAASDPGHPPARN